MLITPSEKVYAKLDIVDMHGRDYLQIPDAFSDTLSM